MHRIGSCSIPIYSVMRIYCYIEFWREKDSIKIRYIGLFNILSTFRAILGTSFVILVIEEVTDRDWEGWIFNSKLV